MIGEKTLLVSNVGEPLLGESPVLTSFFGTLEDETGGSIIVFFLVTTGQSLEKIRARIQGDHANIVVVEIYLSAYKATVRYAERLQLLA